MNSVNLIGNLGQNPDCSVFASGKKVARFSLATNRSSEAAAPVWIPCEMWDGAVDRLQKCVVRQGTKLSVTGALSVNEYDRQIGDQSIKQKKMYIKVYDFDILTPKSAALTGELEAMETERIEEESVTPMVRESSKTTPAKPRKK